MAKNDYTKNNGSAYKFNPITADSLTDAISGWRGALSAGNASFRINGTYDAPASGRRLRRILERKAKKASMSHG